MDIDGATSNDILLLTTGETEKLLLMCFDDFNAKLRPYVRPTKDGGFFMNIKRKGDNWYIPIDYVPKKLRDKLGNKDINLSRYGNNLDLIGINKGDYLKEVGKEETTAPMPVLDNSQMIKYIAENDPSFFLKSTDEKLVTVRYHQLIRG